MFVVCVCAYVCMYVCVCVCVHIKSNDNVYLRNDTTLVSIQKLVAAIQKQVILILDDIWPHLKSEINW